MLAAVATTVSLTHAYRAGARLARLGRRCAVQCPRLVEVLASVAAAVPDAHAYRTGARLAGDGGRRAVQCPGLLLVLAPLSSHVAHDVESTQKSGANLRLLQTALNLLFRPVCDLRFAICDLQFAICDLRFAICDLRFAIGDLRFAICVLG